MLETETIETQGAAVVQSIVFPDAITKHMSSNRSEDQSLKP